MWNESENKTDNHLKSQLDIEDSILQTNYLRFQVICSIMETYFWERSDPAHLSAMLNNL